MNDQQPQGFTELFLTGLDVEGTEKRKIQQETMSERESDE